MVTFSFTLAFKKTVCALSVTTFYKTMFWNFWRCLVFIEWSEAKMSMVFLRSLFVNFCRYSASMKSLNNRYMHLTNYSINKKSSDFTSNDDTLACEGHKWWVMLNWFHQLLVLPLWDSAHFSTGLYQSRSLGMKVKFKYVRMKSTQVKLSGHILPTMLLISV